MRYVGSNDKEEVLKEVIKQLSERGEVTREVRNSGSSISLYTEALLDAQVIVKEAVSSLSDKSDNSDA